MEKRSAALENATLALSSWPTQQQQNFTLVSHMLFAAVFKPVNKWLEL